MANDRNDIPDDDTIADRNDEEVTGRAAEGDEDDDEFEDTDELDEAEAVDEE